MGIVQRQSLKNSIINYLGIIVGGLSTLFIYPLDWSLYGNIQFSLSTATLLSSFLSLGSHSLVNKYFPYFKINEIKGFLSLVFIYSLINVIIISVLLFIFQAKIFEFLALVNFNVEEITRNLFIIFPIGVLLVFIAVLRPQSYNFGRIVIPDFLTNFTVKLIVPLLVLLYYFSIINYQIVGWSLVVFYVLIVIALMVYLKILGGFDFHFQVFSKTTRKKHREMINYMLYGAMNHMGDVLVYKIDLIMIGLLISSTKVGYYSIFLFLSVVLEIPINAVERITQPIVSMAFEKNDLKEIERIYKNVATNLFLLGIILFAVIWLNMQTFFVVMKNGQDLTGYSVVFLLLALTKLLNMSSSLSTSIISFSKFYRVRTLFLVILAVLNILLNYYFIGIFDIVGAAISTAISMFIYNLMKVIFVYVKYKIHPFQKRYEILVLSLIIAVVLPYLLPSLFQSLILSGLISVIYVLIFIFIIYKLQLSEEFNKIIIKYLGKIRK